MPFGKHKGEELSVVPSDYLRWLLEELEEDRLSGWYQGLYEDIEYELATRDRSYSHF